MVDCDVAALADYAVHTGLVEPCERTWAVNSILGALRLDSFTDPGPSPENAELSPILERLADDAYARGVLPENSVVYRDLFDTELMGRLTPRPAQVIEKFRSLYAEGPQKAATV